MWRRMRRRMRRLRRLQRWRLRRLRRVSAMRPTCGENSAEGFQACFDGGERCPRVSALPPWHERLAHLLRPQPLFIELRMIR
jgi:hypothetical protein